MYNDHFGLRTNPFNPTPSPEFIYQSRELREALAHFRYALENREAFLLLTGEVGTGKTTAVQALLRHLPPGTPVAVVTHTTLEPRELIEEISLRFGLNPATGASKPSMIRALEEYFEQQWHERRQAILILDEAHLLSPKVLEEVRLLSNLEREGGKLVQICLVGQPELVGHLQKNELRQLRQRISIRYALRPLSREETGEYLAHRLRAAGCPRPDAIFDAEASEIIHALTFGIPREINVVAGQAMLNAFLAGEDGVRAAHVVSVREDYGFEGLNAPGSAAAGSESRDSGRRTSPPPPPPVKFEDPGEAVEESAGEPDPGPPPGPRPAPRPIPLPPAELRPEPRGTGPRPDAPRDPAPAPRPVPPVPPAFEVPPPARSEVEPAPPAGPRAAVEAGPDPGRGGSDRSPARLSPGVGHAASRPRRRSSAAGTIIFWAVVVVLLGAAGGYYWWQTRANRGGAGPEESSTGSLLATPALLDSAQTRITGGEGDSLAEMPEVVVPGENAEDSLGMATGGDSVATPQGPDDGAPSGVAGREDLPTGEAAVAPDPPEESEAAPGVGGGESADGSSEAFPYPTLLDPAVEDSAFDGPITVQIASFRSRTMADRVLADVSRLTRLSGVVLPAVVSETTWYRILLGSFRDVPSAQEAVIPLLRQHIITEVVVKPVPAAWAEQLLEGTGP